MRHAGFLCVLIPEPHDGILEDAGVTLLNGLRCLENPSGRFNEPSWAFVSVASKIYVARGMSYHMDRLSQSHMNCINASSSLFPKRRW